MSAGPRVKCNVCGDIIQSTHRHDWVSCSCISTESIAKHTSIFVDGGDSYFRFGYHADSDYTILRNPGLPAKMGVPDAKLATPARLTDTSLEGIDG